MHSIIRCKPEPIVILTKCLKTKQLIKRIVKHVVFIARWLSHGCTSVQTSPCSNSLVVIHGPLMINVAWDSIVYSRIQIDHIFKHKRSFKATILIKVKWTNLCTNVSVTIILPINILINRSICTSSSLSFIYTSYWAQGFRTRGLGCRVHTGLGLESLQTSLNCVQVSS